MCTHFQGSKSEQICWRRRGAARRNFHFGGAGAARRAEIFNFVAPARRGALKISNLAALRGAALLGAPLIVMRQSKIKFFSEGHLGTKFICLEWP